MRCGIEIEVAPGELIDKLTILEIKRERIHDAQKRANVETEFAALRSVLRIGRTGFGGAARVARDLRHLAYLIKAQGNLAGARPLFERALAT